MDMELTSESKDKWRWPYLLLPFVYPIVVVVAPIIHINNFVTFIILSPLLALCAIGVFLFAIVSLVMGLKNRRWKSSLSATIFPILVVLFGSVTRPLHMTGEILSFYPMQAHFQKQVDAVSGKEKDKLVVFTMDGWLSISNGFAFDGSDELQLPYGTQSKAWMSRAKTTELQCSWAAKRITGHYYYWDSSC